jgi:hypothetical protein
MKLKKGWIVFIFISFFWASLFSDQEKKFSNNDCLLCHGKPGHSQITPEGKTRSLVVNREEWSQDVHQKKGMVCVDCHLNANPLFHFREGFIPVNCARCHPQEEEEYLKNVHHDFPISLVTPGKELPQCYHCHTTHHVLKHDDPRASIHENNIGDTCGSCHAEVMISSILKGASLGKISGHRKGDLSERFDMNVCISCHYADSAHGNKRVYKDFCSRCHDPSAKENVIMGGTHTRSRRWSGLNIAALVILILFITGIIAFQALRFSGKAWQCVKQMFREPEAESSGEKNGKKENETEKEVEESQEQQSE